MAAPPVRTVAARTAASASMGRFAFMPAFYDFAGKRRASARASFGKGSGRTQADHGVDAAARRLSELDLALVGLDEPLHDREAEARAAGAGSGAPEAVERALALLRGRGRGPRRARAARPRATSTRADTVTRSAGGRGLERVREKVVEDLGETSRRGAHRQRPVELARRDATPRSSASGRHASTRSRMQRRGVDARGRARRRRPRARARAGRRRDPGGDRPRAAPHRGRGSTAGSRAGAGARSAASAARARRRRRTRPASAEAARASRPSR